MISKKDPDTCQYCDDRVVDISHENTTTNFRRNLLSSCAVMTCASPRLWCKFLGQPDITFSLPTFKCECVSFKIFWAY